MSKNNNDKNDDPYDSLLDSNAEDTLKSPEQESARERKWRKLKTKFSQLSQQVQQGFFMGSVIGGTFGAIIGVYQAVVTRRLIMIPLSALISGGSFGFILACGSAIRSDELENNREFVLQDPYWKLKYQYKFLEEREQNDTKNE